MSISILYIYRNIEKARCHRISGSFGRKLFFHVIVGLKGEIVRKTSNFENSNQVERKHFFRTDVSVCSPSSNAALVRELENKMI